MTCGHTRWSVHTLWRDVDILLRLQRGEPVIFVNPDDAARRGLADHDYAAVHNDLGEFVARVKLTPGMQPGQVHIFHAWLATQHVGGGPATRSRRVRRGSRTSRASTATWSMRSAGST